MISPDTTLEEVQNWLRAKVEKGETCPCCKQFAKVYKRKIYSKAVYSLIKLYRLNENQANYYHITQLNPEKVSGGGDFAKLVYWGLIEEKPKEEDETTSRTSGYWKITNKGRYFVERQKTIPTYARIYDSRLLGLTGPEIDIKEALGTKFDYEELMSI